MNAVNTEIRPLPGKKKINKEKLFDNIFAIGLILPAFLVLCLTILYPIFGVIRLSFFKYNLMAAHQIHWNNFENYKIIFSDSEFYHSFLVTIIYVTITVIVQFVIGMFLALLLTSEIRGRNAIRGLMFLPWTIPTVIGGFVWMWIFQPQYGILNFMLKSLHLINSEVNWLGQTNTALGGIIVAAVWKQAPLMMVMLISALQTVPKELSEAADIDGANAFQKLFKITMPCIMSVVKVLIILAVINNFQMFGLFFSMTGGGPSDATTSLAIYTYQTAFMKYDMGKGAAIGVVWMIFLVAFSVIFNNRMSKKQAY